MGFFVVPGSWKAVVTGIVVVVVFELWGVDFSGYSALEVVITRVVTIETGVLAVVLGIRENTVELAGLEVVAGGIVTKVIGTLDLVFGIGPNIGDTVLRTVGVGFVVGFETSIVVIVGVASGFKVAGVVHSGAVVTGIAEAVGLISIMLSAVVDGFMVAGGVSFGYGVTSVVKLELIEIASYVEDLIFETSMVAVTVLGEAVDVVDWRVHRHSKTSQGNWFG